MGYNLSTVLSPAYIASDTILAANNASKNVLGASYYEVKSVTIIQDCYHISSLRTRFDITNGGGGSIRCKIYYNGAAIGTERGPGLATYTEDFLFTNLRYGDVISVYGLATPAGTIANFQICGTETPFFNSLE